VHTQGKPLDPDVDSESLARETEGLVGSDIEAICREASMAAIREAILAGCKQQKLQIHKNHLNAAIEHARSGKGE